MQGITLTFPIVSGKLEAWRRFCQKLAGSRRQAYEASRLRLGISYERLSLLENAFGAASVTTIEADDVGRVLDQIMNSDLAFDRWYRDKLQELHGVRLDSYEGFSQQTPSLEDQELLFEWTVPSATPE